MPPLNNARHEAFCRALLEGHSIDESYTLAGYSKNRGNACRLNADENIQARLAELQGEAAANAKVTVASICRELDEANAVAKAKGQAAAMVSAATLRAKLAGLMVDKVEVGGPGAFDHCETVAEVVDGMLARLIEQFKPVDTHDRQALIDLANRHWQEMQDWLETIEARPSLAYRIDARNLNTPWHEHETHKPTSPLRIGYRGNGKASV